MRRSRLVSYAAAILALLPAHSRASERMVVREISVTPEQIQLQGPDSVQGLLVQGTSSDGRLIDLTHRARYATSAPDFARVDPTGVISAEADGEATIRVTFGQHTLKVPVQVSGTTHRRVPHFQHDVIPILSKYKCNTSGCHGKAEGQNGFKLSVFGFDPTADYEALVMQGRGRRTFPAAAQQSLLLTKISGTVPHGGGIRLTSDQREYRLLRDWVAAGTPWGAEHAPHIERVSIEPRERVLLPGSRQQVRVTAHHSDGRKTDVTHIAGFQTNQEGLATVDDQGLVQVGSTPGQAAIMVSYMGAVDTFQVLIPRAEEIADYPALAANNRIDEFVNAKLRKLNILPSPMAADAEFVRRLYLDLIGTLPTASEVSDFLASSDPEKKDRLLEQLLARQEFVDYWALKLADRMRVDRRKLGHEVAFNYYHWIRESVAENEPIDQMVSELLTLAGNLNDSPQAAFYQAVGGPDELASTTSQVFLGVRIACAKCHHHPFDRWSQTDYYGMHAFFKQVKRVDTPRGPVMSATGNPETRHPRTSELIQPHALGTKQPAQVGDGDRREVLASWMTSPDNPWFARNEANRIWAHFMGRGLVEPVDDFRDTNPPSHPELLTTLANHLAESGFDRKELIRFIVRSQTYQRSSAPNDTNLKDEQNFSRALLRPLDAEVLLDAVCQVTGTTEKFRGVPHGSRAIQLWDSDVDHYFLTLFGRPARKTDCECERNAEPTVGQVLHVLNSPEIQDKLSWEGGWISQLVGDSPSHTALVEQMYLTFFARNPSSEETQTAVDFLSQSEDSREAAEDLAWSLMNSLEFLFNH